MAMLTKSIFKQKFEEFIPQAMWPHHDLVWPWLIEPSIKEPIFDLELETISFNVGANEDWWIFEFSWQAAEPSTESFRAFQAFQERLGDILDSCDNDYFLTWEWLQWGHEMALILKNNS